MERTKRLWHLSPARYLAAALLVGTVGAAGRLSVLPAPTPTHAAATCVLGGPTGAIKHVIYLQFDNFHFKRDNPNVPSDLEQTPALLNFIKSNGVLLTDHHTSLISHTADDFITSFTGLYGAHQGIATAHNSYRYWNPDAGSTSSVSAFQYWNDNILQVGSLKSSGGTTTIKPFIPAKYPLSPDPDYNLLNEGSNNTPAPWVPYTRAGCDFGAIGGANLEAENTSSDLAFIYGINSPQVAEAQGDQLSAEAHYEGVAVHCTLDSAFCNGDAADLRPDLLPNEPGGYAGYQALFGARYVTPLINPAPTGSVTDPSCTKNFNPATVKLGGECFQNYDGQVMADSSNGETVPGFPFFDSLTPANTLSYIAAMQEKGIPVTYGYLTHAHTDLAQNPFGPGQKEYEDYLKDFNTSFQAFFADLASHGIDKTNTLFIFTSDEEDRFAGAQLTGCDGVTTNCTYGPNQLGELSTDFTGLMHQTNSATPAFDIQSDVAPSIYIHGDPPNVGVNQTPPPADAGELGFAHTAGQIVTTNLYTGSHDQLVERMADPLEMNILHMLNADPARTPNLNLFGNENYFLSSGPTTCSTCVQIGPGFAWIHGGYQATITTDWLGFVGPGVKTMGLVGYPLGPSTYDLAHQQGPDYCQNPVNHCIFTDEADIRPTMMALLAPPANAQATARDGAQSGVQEDYAHDGRVITEILDPSVVPARLRAQLGQLSALGRAYKDLNAPLGTFGQTTLRLDTQALQGSSAQYMQTYNQLRLLASLRDRATAQLQPLVDFSGAAPGGRAVPAGHAAEADDVHTALAQARHVLSELQQVGAGRRIAVR
jgi:hypothetical protein